MPLYQTVRLALRALRRNPLRSFLTTLGIVIGVAAVIAMVAIGEGAKARVQSAFASMGSNLLILLPGTTTAGGAHGGFGTMPTITWDDLKAIETQASAVRAAAPVLHTVAQVQSQDQNWTTQVTGTTPEYFGLRSWRLASGSSFGASDLANRTKVAVLGQTVVDQLFGAGADPVGDTVRIKNVPFQVIGVLARKGQSPIGQDYDDAVFIPDTTYRADILGGLGNYIAGVVFIGASSPAGTVRAAAEVTALLRERHHLPAGVPDDFSIRNLTEMASAFEQGTSTMTTLLASIAGVSLFVGGIGIMNIMLVSVTERTREIGLRMAVGAKPVAILAQFLVEALSLAVIGGLLGVAIGLFGAARLAASFGWPMLIRPDIIVVAVGFSALVGVGFGLYPARKAARLDPIDALRYE